MSRRFFFIFVATACGAFGCSNSGGASDAGNDSAIEDGNVEASTDGNAGDGACTYAYCEDFEKYDAGVVANGASLGPWKATVSGMGVTFGVDATKPYAGKQSLHVTVPSNAGEDAGTTTRGSLNQTAASGLVQGNDVFGRAMVFYSNTGGNDLPLNVHSWLFNATGDSQIADGGVAMNMGGGGMKMQLNYHPPLPLTEKSVQGGAITAGAWHCVQWEYNGSGAPPADIGQVWVDGTLALTAAKSEGWNYATPWSSFDFGFTHYELLANAVDVYLDDFALDGAMIPCPP